MAAWGESESACHNTDCNWLGGEKQTTSNLPLAYIIYRENHYHYYHSDKKTLAEPPRSSFSVIKEFVPSPQTSLCPLFCFFLTQTNVLTKIFPNCSSMGNWPQVTDHRMTYFTLSSNQTKNNKQEELATRPWKHRPHSQFCLEAHFLFNTDVVLFLAYDLCAASCRWRSEHHCCGVCSLDMKKETVNEWTNVNSLQIL